MPTESSAETLEQTIEDEFDKVGNPILTNKNSYFEFNPFNLPDKSPLELQVFTYYGVQYRVISHLIHAVSESENTYVELCDLKEVNSKNKIITSVVVGYSALGTNNSDLKNEKNWRIFLLGDITLSRKTAVESANKKNNLGIDEEIIDSLR